MTTAVLHAAFAENVQASTKTRSLTRKFRDALTESHVRSVARELRRHEALMADLLRRQDHSSGFLMQSNDLPFKI